MSTLHTIKNLTITLRQPSVVSNSSSFGLCTVVHIFIEKNLHKRGPISFKSISQESTILS